jgi:hypothetical protein
MTFGPNIRRLAEERLTTLREEGKVTGLTVVRRNGLEVLLIGIAAETDVDAPGYDSAIVEAIRSRLSEALGDIPFRLLGEPFIPIVLASPRQAEQTDLHPTTTLGIRSAKPARQSAVTNELDADPLDRQVLADRLTRLERQVAQLPPMDFLMAASMGASLASFIAVTVWLVFPDQIRELIGIIARWLSPSG